MTRRCYLLIPPPLSTLPRCAGKMHSKDCFQFAEGSVDSLVRIPVEPCVKRFVFQHQGNYLTTRQVGSQQIQPLPEVERANLYGASTGAVPVRFSNAAAVKRDVVHKLGFWEVTEDVQMGQFTRNLDRGHFLEHSCAGGSQFPMLKLNFQIARHASAIGCRQMEEQLPQSPPSPFPCGGPSCFRMADDPGVRAEAPDGLQLMGSQPLRKSTRRKIVRRHPSPAPFRSWTRSHSIHPGHGLHCHDRVRNDLPRGAVVRP